MYGVFIEYLEQLEESDRQNLTDLIYDDNCHLSRFASNKKRATRNVVTQLFADIRKYVDRFHFGNHVDKWCIENCNPYDAPQLNNINTLWCCM